MESNYRNREFEQYIKENADQYRMFPSEKVWKGINNTLHTRRRWYGAGLAFLLLITGTAVTWVMMSYPVSKNQSATTVSTTQNKFSAQSTTPAEPSSEALSSVLPFSNRPAPVKKAEPIIEESAVIPFILVPEDAQLVSLPPSEQPVVVRNEKNQLVPLLIPQKISSFNTTDDNNRFYQFETDDIIVDAVVPAEARKQVVEVSSSDRPAFRGEVNYPINFESVTNAYMPAKLSKKISWQFYITPTISYRKLDENKSFNNSTSGYPFASMSDVNKAVTHKPDMGLQVGASARYPVTKNLKIRGGLQFNINRYDIKAFAYFPEVATINLNGGNGNNSVSAWTPYRTYNGYKSDWLKNFYFSVSAPIGAELTLIGNSKTSFGIAGTVQPTYIIKDRAYLISSDYKNYATFPWLIRHVNVNTGFETFVNYTSGKTKWQIGPQVRYQILSSFHNKYPVKENLFDFGVKVGVTLNN